MREKWLELEDFPRHAVSDQGRVINHWSNIIQKPMVNQMGITYVRLSAGGRQHTRSVATLVARTFLNDVPRPEYFDTPIHLNGDKTDCRAENLMWRPRWFAVKYHQQFKPWERANRYGTRHPVRIVETLEEFPNSWEAAIKYGLLDQDIYLSIMNVTVVFPINKRFEMIE